jgi:hypothetical protein
MQTLNTANFVVRYMQHIVGSLLMCASLAAGAQPVGEVAFSRGVGFAQAAGEMPRTLGKGLPLNEGDRLTTAQGAVAIIKLKDGTRLTLRPNSEIIMKKFQYKEGDTDNSMMMQLLRGGFRAITGLITKDSPDAAKIQTATATMGIRGTDFDARVCAKDCKAESSRVSEVAKPNEVLASAKMVSVDGDLHALDSTGVKRRLVVGGSVYSGDIVETGTAAKAVLAFRDGSRMTLGSRTQFKVDNFEFNESNPSAGRFLVSLLQGSMRTLTGLIGKANNRNVEFKTATATIGIRGTGLDLDCAAVQSCSFFTWLGTIEVTPNGQTALQVLQAGQGLFVSRDAIRPLTTSTLDRLPRPDTVPVNMQQLFSSGGVSPDEEGLFVSVRDGHVEVTTANETLHLGKGETGFAGADGRTGRPADTPLFIQFDRVTMPNSPNPMLSTVMGEVSQSSSDQCP